MSLFEPRTRRLALILGLGDLDRGMICHGYSHDCRCVDCVERGENVSEDFREWLDGVSDPMPRLMFEHRPRQPWEAAA